MSEPDSPALRAVSEQVNGIEHRIEEIEEVLEGSPRWGRAGLVREQGRLHEDLEKVKRMLSARKEEEESRQKRNERYQQAVLAGIVSLIVGLVLFVLTGGGF